MNYSGRSSTGFNGSLTKLVLSPFETFLQGDPSITYFLAALTVATPRSALIIKCIFNLKLIDLLFELINKKRNALIIYRNLWINENSNNFDSSN